MPTENHAERRENSLLTLLVVAGLFLIAVSFQLQDLHAVPHALATTLGGVGEAAFIAGVLGFIVDKGLKTQLAKDALSFFVGWEVTPKLREAVNEIIRIPCVRRGFTVTYKLERCEQPKGFVRLTSETRFSVDNMTNRRQPYAFQSRVEPTAFAEVKAAGLRNDTLRMATASAENGPWTDVPTPSQDIAGVVARNHSTNIPPAGKQWFLTQREQYFPDNFFVILDLLAPACEGASVVVEPHPGFSVNVRFGADSELDESKTVGNRWEYQGVLLPGQHVRIRWAPK